MRLAPLPRVASVSSTLSFPILVPRVMKMFFPSARVGGGSGTRTQPNTVPILTNHAVLMRVGQYVAMLKRIVVV